MLAVNPYITQIIDGTKPQKDPGLAPVRLPLHGSTIPAYPFSLRSIPDRGLTQEKGTVISEVKGWRLHPPGQQRIHRRPYPLVVVHHLILACRAGTTTGRSNSTSLFAQNPVWGTPRAEFPCE